jgi:hypothetical protein
VAFAFLLVAKISDEVIVSAGIEVSSTALWPKQPADFLGTHGTHAAQNNATHLFWMLLSICECKGDTPATAQNDIPCRQRAQYAAIELLSEHLNVCDEVRSIVIDLGTLWGGRPASSLVKQDHTPQFGVEKASVVGKTACAWSTVQEQGRLFCLRAAIDAVVYRVHVVYLQLAILYFGCRVV